MSENQFLFKKSDEIAKKKAEVTSSLKNRLAQMKRNLKRTLLIDLSGSMHDLMDGGQSKREAVEQIVGKLPEGIKKFAFSNHCEQIRENEFPMMGGGTNMAGAFDEMKRQAIDEFILLTDGLPDSAPAALRSAKGLKIEIIYIGPMPRPKFLEDLANQTGGSFTSVDVLESGAFGEIEDKIQKLLNA